MVMFLTVLCSELDEFWTREEYWGLGRKWWTEEIILYYAIYIAMFSIGRKGKAVCLFVSLFQRIYGQYLIGLDLWSFGEASEVRIF